MTPRNSASNPAQMISSAARSRTSCWEAQKPMTIYRMPATMPSHHALLTILDWKSRQAALSAGRCRLDDAEALLAGKTGNIVTRGLS